VYTQAYRLVGDRQEAEDVAQDAYVRVFRSVAGFRGEAQFETWLYRIVANAAMTRLRKRRRFGDLPREPSDEPARSGSSERPDDRALDRVTLERALRKLPDAMRTVVLLKDVYGLSCREIGKGLGVSEGAVKVRLHRARRRLKEALFGGSVRDEV